MILQRILDHKKAEVRRKESRGYRSELNRRISEQSVTLEFVESLRIASKDRSPALIAEVKKSSPSQGLMRPSFADDFNPNEIAQSYKDNGATAISVLTDLEFFNGCLDHLLKIKTHIALPTLNKEFIVHEVQIYEARAYGADAVLLIVAALDRIQLEDFYTISIGLELDVLIEIHNENELDTVLERIPQAKLIGINNRDLKTFSTDLATTERLAKRIPSDKLIVSESGIHKRDDVLRIIEAGAKVILVGESLLRSEDISAKIQELLYPIKKDSNDRNSF